MERVRVLDYPITDSNQVCGTSAPYISKLHRFKMMTVAWSIEGVCILYV